MKKQNMSFDAETQLQAAASPLVLRLFSWVGVFLALAIPLAIFMGYAALEHNPQEEFCVHVQDGFAGNYMSWGSPCLIQWPAVLAVVGIWLLVQIAVFAVLRILWIRLRGRRSAL